MKLESVLILGASSDIGLALMRALDGEAGQILAHGNHGQERLRAHAAAARSRVHCLAADLADPAQAERLAQEAAALAPCPSAIVHLAAPRLRVARFKETRPEDLEEHFQVQVQGPAAVLRRLLPAMGQAGHGQVLFLLSDVTLGAAPGGMAPYTVGKFALLGLQRSLAAEYGPRGLTVQALSPGMADTAFLQHLHRTVVELGAKASPQGRLRTADEVAGRLFQLLTQPGAAGGGNLAMD
ncbi:MAG TPA: SDR family oxidoreductase [bacterium]|nr:SDR family oxidoreductase [bacterium]